MGDGPRTEPRAIGDQAGHFSYPSGKAWRTEDGGVAVRARARVSVRACEGACSSRAASFRLNYFALSIKVNNQESSANLIHVE